MIVTHRLQLFGRVVLEQAEQPAWRFPTRKAMALLGYLARQSHPVPRSELTNLLWGDLPDARSRRNLTRELSLLSAQLPGCFQADYHTIRWAPPAQVWVDTDAFLALLAPALAAPAYTHTPPKRTLGDPWFDRPGAAAIDSARLAAAVALYGGEFMDGLYLDDCPDFETWLTREREYWRRLVMDQLKLLIAHHALHQQDMQAIVFARRCLELEPWHEEAHRALMILLARGGNRPAALAQYETCRRMLAAELALEPAPEITTLYEQIRSGDLAVSKPAASDRNDRVTPPSSQPQPIVTPNLPSPTTTFVGRNAELDQIARRLGDPACRLLTLLGPGGIGKTRLALAVAAAHASAFANGAAFVALAPLTAPDQVVSAIGEAIGLEFNSLMNPTAQLIEALHMQHILLILDNFEHMLDAADLMNRILQHASQVRLLVTSRERLNLMGEWIYDLDGLTYPAAEEGKTPPYNLVDYSAVQLFAHQAARVQPHFQLSAATLPSVIRICRHVDGMPLAIELAATWVRTLSAREIAQKLDAGLDFLATTLRDMPPRHRSLRAVFDQSWNLLVEPEQALLARLAVFRGGCTKRAAIQVAGATAQSLAALIDKSLLRREPIADATHAGSTSDDQQVARFGMLEPIREYALEQLAAHGEAAPVRRAHAMFYMTLAEQAALELDGPAKQLWVTQLLREHENMRSALAWSLQDVALERAAVGDRAITASQAASRRELGLRMAVALSRFWLFCGYTHEGRDWLARLLTASADDVAVPVRVRAQALYHAALLAQAQDEFMQASTLFAASAALSQEERQPHDQTVLTVNAAMTARNKGVYWEATALLEECLAQQRAAGIRASIAHGGLGLVLFRLALVLREQGEYARSTALYEECLALHRELADRSGVAVALLGLGDLARDQGDTAGMRAYCEQCLALFRELGEQWGVGFSLNNLALVAYRTGDLPQAAVLTEEACTLFRSVGLVTGIAETLTTWSNILAAQGQNERAHALLTDALALTRQQGPQWLLANQLEDLAGLACAKGDMLPAARLFGTATALRTAIGVPLPPARRASYEQIVAEVRAALGPDTWLQARAAGRARLATLEHDSLW